MEEKSRYHQQWYAQHYDHDRFGESFGQYLELTEVATLLSALAPHSGSVLDVGAGTGKLSLPLLKQGRKVVSLDSSLQMLGVARSKALGGDATLQPVVCDAHKLCFGDLSFECVVCSRVLMHLRNHEKAIDEFCRVAEKAIILDFPPVLSFAGVDSLLRRFIGAFSARMHSYKAFCVRRIIRRLQENDFEVVLLQRHFFLPVALHRILDKPKISDTVERFLNRWGLVQALGAPVTIKAIRGRRQDTSPST